MFGFISPSTLIIAGLYAYVAIAAFKMEVDSGNGKMIALTKALSWPATIWHSIRRLYDV